ncbi:alanine racemase [Gilvimarinus chinensis]|uniref:alanine racemase n=1 Tax=Gilvimarinus chinensis TaxID=396005 RepID=UPI00036CC6EB|nr:alanine racemase [Gilvimarinus chinensis]
MDTSTGVLTVNLDAVVRNWHLLCAQAPNSIVAAVIKADAYGLGARRVGQVLHRAGCRDFFFATVDEALAVADVLPGDARRYILGGFAVGEERKLLEAGLTPVLSTLAEVQRWQQLLAVTGAEAQCALKFDSGMTRMGLAAKDLLSLGADESKCRRLGVRLVMSHLACADEALHPQNREQLSSFNSVRDQLRAHCPDVAFSLANSSGIFLGDDYHADLVRPGAALYGVNPDTRGANPMQPVVGLSLPVRQLRQLKRPSRIGYGAELELPAGTVLAVAAGGYADGLHRILGASGVGEMAGVEVAVAGRVSMDSTIFDVTAVPNIQAIARGELKAPSIEVLNAQLDVSRVAARNRALGYEVLTSVRAARYRREYRGGEQ